MRKSSRPRGALFALSLAVATFLTLPPGAAAKPNGAREFWRGVALHDRGKCDQAIPKFEKSFLHNGWPLNVFLIARCHELLGRPRQAVVYYGRYIDLSGAKEDLRARARERIAEIEAPADAGDWGRRPVSEATRQDSPAPRFLPRVDSFDESTVDTVVWPEGAPTLGDARSVSRRDSGVQLGMLVGPALPSYGSEDVAADPTIEFGFWGGVRGFLTQRIGGDLSLVALLSPFSYDAVDESHTAWFGSLLLRPSLVLRRRDVYTAIGAGVGVTALWGADEMSPFFRGTTDAGGVFFAPIVRPQLDLGYDVTSRLTVVLTPFALDYSPAFEKFTTRVAHVVRLHFAAGLAAKL